MIFHIILYFSKNVILLIIVCQWVRCHERLDHNLIRGLVRLSAFFLSNIVLHQSTDAQDIGPPRFTPVKCGSTAPMWPQTRLLVARLGAAGEFKLRSCTWRRF